jgi:hypothetical protein
MTQEANPPLPYQRIAFIKRADGRVTQPQRQASAPAADVGDAGAEGERGVHM